MTLYGIDDNWLQDIGLGVVAGMAFILLSSATSVSMALPTPIYPQTAVSELVNILAQLIVVGLIASTLEESLFRGIVLSFTNTILPIAAAVVATSICFSLFHWRVYGAGLEAAFVGAFVFSIIACVLTIKTESILPSTIMHGLVNVHLYLGAAQLLTIGW